MASPVFGDFLTAAGTHLRAAETAGAGEPADVTAAAQDLHQLVQVLSRYCHDLAPWDEVEASRQDYLHPWERAAVDVAEAVDIAAGYLRRGVHGARSLPADLPGPGRVSHLASASRQLTVGRDLLRTHFTVDPDGFAQERSEWARVLTSVPVTRALTGEIARWSGVLAPLAAQLARSAAREDAAYRTRRARREWVRAEFEQASRWLHIASTAARPALDADPVQATDTVLLHAVPAAGAPPRQRPGSSRESVAELCHGITVSAARLRAAAQGSQERARWSPGVTSGGWQWTAQASVITSHLSEMALRTAGLRAGQLPDPQVSHAQLSRLADLMAGTRAAWSQVDRAWDTMMTESRMLATPAMTDASDLLLRMGRLAWDDPQWTPDRSRRAPSRTPASLIPEPHLITTVVAAIHHWADALARIAETEIAAVDAAARAGRLYVPTRSLPEDYDIPRPYARAPDHRCAALRDTYKAAHHASLQAALELDRVAVAAGATSAPLALARSAAPSRADRPASRDQRGSQTVEPTSAKVPFSRSRASSGEPGPLETALRNRQVSDPILILRAAVIDNAAHQLLADAEDGPPRSSPARPTGRSQTSSTPAGLAAQSFPDRAAARAPSARPDQPASQGARPVQRNRRLSRLPFRPHRSPDRTRGSEGRRLRSTMLILSQR